ncbi:MAG TPA: efflux transporter outer membrane subunit [Steroidobacteraceae bacterium]|nr:efflux transporter outer membrane subunit [Steroidobacteraceae bacterium]HNS26544.1 efflux transporter outer membrane subunit [Steroidobacteraceae bacterium]
MRRHRLMLVLTMAMALTGCAVGPDYVRPDLPVPGSFTVAPAAAPDSAGEVVLAPAVDPEFWRGLGDPLLSQLVDAALESNHDLRIALANYDRANALLRGARFDRYPTVTAGGSAASERATADAAPGASREERDLDRYGADIRAGWELDLFGRVRRSVEAQRAERDAAASDLAALQIVIVGEVARSYMELRGLQERLRVARANAVNQRDTLELVEARVGAGRDTDFDRSRARAQLETTLARVPALESAVAVTLHRLAVLTGRPPAALTAQLASAAPLPALPASVDAGTPGELLRRRPDVIAAEARLHAATARVGIATADLFPRFTLAGLIGTQAIDTDALFERDSEVRFAALGVDWSFLDVGRVRARIAAADADAAAALAGYEQAVLLALEDTENALVRLAKARLEDRHLESAALDSATAARLARLRFEAGAVDLLDVLDAERTQLLAQDAFADARTRSATAAVGLYRALAGGYGR